MFCDFINSFFSVPDLQYIQLSVQGYKECQFSDSDLSLLKEDLDLMSVQHSLGQPSNFPRVDIVKLQKNNVTLFNLNLFPLLYQDLKLLNNLNNTPNLDHMHFLISLLYLLILSNVEDPSLSKQLVEDTEPPFVVFLFNLVLKLADGNKNHYPVKKILMLLDKVLESSLCISNLENCKEISRKCNNLRRSCKNRITKCNPLDIQLQKSYLELKYPSYIARDIPELKKYNIVLEQEANLKFMTQSLTNVPHNYSNTNNVPLRVQQQQNIYPVIQPLVSSCNEPPNYFSETFDISKKNLFVKLSFLQMYREKEIFRRTVEMNEEEKSNFFEFIRDSKETSNTNDNAKNELCWLNDDVYNSNKVKGEFATECLCQLRRIETVYKCILPLLNSYISTLIRLVYYVNLGPQQQQEQNQKQEENLTSKQLRSKLLVNFDHAKQKHVMTLAMSNIMVNILKALKVHNVFCFEFVSTLLNDNNCGILILKMLSTWFQNLNTTPQHEAAQKTEQNSSYGTWLSDAEEPDELNLFSFYIEKNGSTRNIRDFEKLVSPSRSFYTERCTTNPCRRNLTTTVNLLKVLHYITEEKNHRILSLVQWKSSAVLKRILKTNHLSLHPIVLKLLKRQIPFLGRKWKNANMKVISMIYSKLKPALWEDYLSGDSDVDIEEAQAQEQNIRNLIDFYHERVYKNIYQKVEEHSTISDIEKLKLEKEIKEKEVLNQLDENFKENYKEWLNLEVFGILGETRETLFTLTRRFSREMLKEKIERERDYVKENGNSIIFGRKNEFFGSNIIEEDYDEKDKDTGNFGWNDLVEDLMF